MTLRTQAFATFTSSPERPAIADAVDVILSRLRVGEKTTSVVKPPRTGKSNVIRLAAIEALETGLVAGSVVLSPWIALRDQIVATKKIQEMVQQFKIPGSVTIKTIAWDARRISPDFLKTTPCHIHSFTLAAAQRPLCLTVLIDAAIHCRDVLGKPLLVFIDEGHMVAGADGWGDLAAQLVASGAHVVLLTGTPERADNLAPYGFETVQEVIATDVVHTTFGPVVGDVRRMERRSSDRVSFRLVPDFTMTRNEAWTNDYICRLRARWVKCKIDGVDLPDVEEETLGAVVRDPAFIEQAIEIMLDEVALRRNLKQSTSCIVYVGSDRDGETRDGHAKLVLQILRRKWRERFGSDGLIELATLNENDEGNKALKVIQRFADGHSDGIVVKQMGGVGLDVDHLKIALDLSTVRTPGNAAQRWLRVATIWGDIKHATLILPETRKTRALYAKIVTDEGGDATRLVNSEILEEYEVPVDEDHDDDDLLITEPEASGASEMEANFTRESADVILRVMRAYPELGKLPFADVQALVDKGAVVIPDEDAGDEDAADVMATVVNVGDEARKLHDKINAKCGELAGREAPYQPGPNGAAYVEARRRWMNRAKDYAGIRTKLQQCQDTERLQRAFDYLKAPV